MPTINNASPVSVNPNLPSWRGAMPSLPQQEILMETKMATPSLWGQIIDLSKQHTAKRNLDKQFNPSGGEPYSPLQKALYMNPYTSGVGQPVELNPSTYNTNIAPEITNTMGGLPAWAFAMGLDQRGITRINDTGVPKELLDTPEYADLKKQFSLINGWGNSGSDIFGFVEDKNKNKFAIIKQGNGVWLPASSLAPGAGLPEAWNYWNTPIRYRHEAWSGN